MNRGVIYIVWGNNYEDELNSSIISLNKYNPNLPYEVITFNSNRRHLIIKSNMYDLSPFDSTLFLDIDTVVLGNLDYGFEKAEQFNLALCQERAAYLRRWPAFQNYGDCVEYNTGVIFFTKNTENQTLFDHWKYAANYCFDHYHLNNDQPTFSYSVNQLKINPFVLPNNVWNLRDYDNGSMFGPVKIWHTHVQSVDSVLEEKLIQEHEWKFYDVAERNSMSRRLV